MLNFKCWSCEQEFQVCFENLFNKISIQCHNCDNPLPKSALEPLRKFSESYMDIVDALHKENTYESSWSISVKATDELIPDKTGQYSYINDGKDESYWKVRRKPIKSDFDDVELNF